MAYQMKKPKKSAEERFYDVLMECMSIVREMVIDACVKGFKEIDSEIIEMSQQFPIMLRPRDIIMNFISQTKSYWNLIEERDDLFILEGRENFFGDIPMEEIKPLKLLWEAHIDQKISIEEEDRVCVWNYFDAFVGISKSFIVEQEKNREEILKYAEK